jgi:hypothetical protein
MGVALYAGVCETDITPPPGVWLSGYAFRSIGAAGVHDELCARVLALDDGISRVIIVSLDLICLDADIVQALRCGIASGTGAAPEAILLNCSHTHAGPSVRGFRSMGGRDDAYVDVMTRKVVGAANQAASELRPAHLTYGEAAAQIGVNRRCSGAAGTTDIGVNYGGPVAPVVQTICVNAPDGRTFALLFSHACHPTTMGGDNLLISADWPGAAVAHLKSMFRGEGAEGGVAPGALPIFLQGCCGDINPHPRHRGWELVEAHGRTIAEAAHAARWSAHARCEPALEAAEETVAIPLVPPPSPAECDRLVEEWTDRLAQDRASGADAGHIMHSEGQLEWAKAARALAQERTRERTMDFTIQRLSLGGVQIVAFPGEMFVQYQLDFVRRSPSPVLSLGYSNGCWNYVPTAAEYARGGYEVEGGYRYYGTLMFAPSCEPLIRAAAYRLLGLEGEDLTPYPPPPARAR